MVIGTRSAFFTSPESMLCPMRWPPEGGLVICHQLQLKVLALGTVFLTIVIEQTLLPFWLMMLPSG